MMTELMEIASEFSLDPRCSYLDAATFGLPPRSTVGAMERALHRWSTGEASWLEEWDRPAEATRSLFASLAGVSTDGVALLPAVSVGVGLVAAGLGPGDEVVVPVDEFESVLFPLLVAEKRGARVHRVPFADLADGVQHATTLVAFSLVQMQTGRRANLAAILERVREVGARSVVDATQAIPFLDPGEDLGKADVVVCAAYKHLLSPRGVAFMHVHREARDGIAPLLANWRAQDDPYGDYFGGPLELATGAARFDVSLAWLPWVGAIESLRSLVAWRDDGELERVKDVARHLASGLGVPAPASTLVCIPIRDVEAAQHALLEAGVRASARGAGVRLSPHVYTTERDVDRAVEALDAFRMPG
jgi:selenocysteine lyase/cysteine desulfurase